VAASKKLGRGLESLLSRTKGSPGEQIVEIDPEEIRENPFQPREVFEDAALEGLIESIEENGLIQPVVVRRDGDRYELIAGERRWRAAKSLNRPIPAIVRDIDDDKMLEMALVENLQREDLNPIEKAKAFRQLIDKFGLTQEQAAQRIGVERSTVANMIRLLDLPAQIQKSVSRETISMGHARALLAFNDKKKQVLFAKRIEKEGLSVRETERLVYEPKKVEKKAKKAEPARSSHLVDLETQLREALGTKVQVEEKRGRGKIVIEFYGQEQFQQLLESLGVGSTVI